MKNAQVPGFVLTAPNGWYFGTCSMGALSLIILGSSLIGAFILAVVITVIVCVYVRKRKARSIAGSSVVNSNDVFVSPNTYEEEESVSEVSTDNNKKKKKKKYAKPVQYKETDALVSNSRYYQARQNKRY